MFTCFNRCDLGSGGGTGTGAGTSSSPSTIQSTASDSAASSDIGGTGNTGVTGHTDPDTVIHSAAPSSGTGTGTGTSSSVAGGSSGDTSGHGSAAAGVSGTSGASQSGTASSGAMSSGAGSSVAGSGVAGAGGVDQWTATNPPSTYQGVESCPEGPVPSFPVGQNYTLEVGSGYGINRWAWVSGTVGKSGLPSAAQRANPAIVQPSKFRIEHIPNTRCRFVIYSASAVPGPAYLTYSGNFAHGGYVFANWAPGRQTAAEVYIGLYTNGQFRITTGPASDGSFARLGLSHGSAGDMIFWGNDGQTLWKIMPTS
ncbi:hypothetical protein PENSPDRAFT_243051 [Peniophora sp. CONT]|nr:hypothetical protein PENSPDRAFT_243051 [Peniophora sp. CONT]